MASPEGTWHSSQTTGEGSEGVGVAGMGMRGELGLGRGGVWGKEPSKFRIMKKQGPFNKDHQVPTVSSKCCFLHGVGPE